MMMRKLALPQQLLVRRASAPLMTASRQCATTTVSAGAGSTPAAAAVSPSESEGGQQTVAAKEQDPTASVAGSGPACDHLQQPSQPTEALNAVVSPTGQKCSSSSIARPPAVTTANVLVHGGEHDKSDLLEAEGNNASNYSPPIPTQRHRISIYDKPAGTKYVKRTIHNGHWQGIKPHDETWGTQGDGPFKWFRGLIGPVCGFLFVVKLFDGGDALLPKIPFVDYGPN